MTVLLAAEDLLHARMRDTSLPRDRTLGRTASDRCADGITPLRLSTRTPRGGAAHTGQVIHLRGGVDSLRESADAVWAARVVKGDGDAESTGLVAERVVGDGLGTECCVDLHMARILAASKVVKAPSPLTRKAPA